MKKLRKISKEYCLRQIICYWLVFYMLLGIPAQIALAPPPVLPQGYELLGGGSDLPDYGTSDAMYLRNIANGTIVRWNGGFNINGGQLAQFEFITDGSSIMNRDETGNLSNIFGTLNANGNVFIINPAGIVFGGGATINVNQLVASGLDMTADAFNDTLDGVSKMVFSGGSGDVTIDGLLDADGTDSLYFVGENVFNDGHIFCPDGLVVMAAGEEMYLGQPGSPVIVELADLTAGPGNQVNNDGGVGLTGDDRVRKLVLAAGDVWSKAINKNVEQLAVVSTGNVYFDGDVHAYDDGGSDAVADVTIITGGDLEIDYDIEAEAIGDGVFDAIAGVTINAGGYVEVKPDSDVTVKA